MTYSNRKIIFAERPTGEVTRSAFNFVEETLPELKDGEVLVKNHYISIDPYQRGRMKTGKSYAKPMDIGDVIVAATVGEVLESQSDALPVGTMVAGYLGWQEKAIARAKHLQMIPATGGVSPSAYLGAAGLPGVTAWMGLRLIGEPKPGETVVVSAAAGAVGSVALQLAKNAGARTVGIAGGAAKCAYIVDKLGADAAVDYRADDFADQLAAATGDGVDVYFDNVGGPVSDAVFARLNNFARVPLCGAISEYQSKPAPIYNLTQAIITRARLQGFICTDRMDLWNSAVEELVELIAQGKIIFNESVAEGLDAAPEAFISMLSGGNLGKQLVRLA
ncbi:NADP-dependent oxidoreductase [Sphingobium indicum]|uniref:2-alkenal reductase n=2 Tax=Sphingobium indicum TaxID=332055 RepID=A0A1L5BS66_SPHIB|nr:NADP-dependent oxidoreductase [Sphingobium indicum]APL95723.1 2-alkenal reductase [Sphingobium indicum B90A]KEZ00368.1 2-alkenal reductase [Sphingomonas sp. BHC-A]NYI23948.1 hypothetical protein [Sphingobium indicum]RYM00097.1 NADP-dependent oxidoreductase [Sphingobium indicum]